MQTRNWRYLLPNIYTDLGLGTYFLRVVERRTRIPISYAYETRLYTMACDVEMASVILGYIINYTID